MKILFTGGGTLGPVTPLLAVAEAWKKIDPSVEFVWVGTHHGPERVFVEKEGIRFVPMTTARLVRYVSVEWLSLPFRFGAASAQAYAILSREKPDLIAAAGGYTSVPIVMIASMMKIPTWIHQSDARPIMTNQLLAPFASLITVAWEKTKHAFPKSKTTVVGNPVRESIRNGIKARAELMFGCNPNKPTVFIFGGGTGSSWLNQFVDDTREELLLIANVIHVTGKGKKSSSRVVENEKEGEKGNYFAVESMMDEMPDAYAIADVVVCRAGTGAISELAALKKAAIIIPLLDSPQEDNAKMIETSSVVLHQGSVTSRDVLNQVRRLLNDPMEQISLGARLSISLETNCAERIVGILKEMKKKT